MSALRKFAEKYLKFGLKEEPAKRQERFIKGVLHTRAFAKLSRADQLLSLGRLLVMFRHDFGFTPASLDKTLQVLHEKVKRQSTGAWQELYSTRERGS